MPSVGQRCPKRCWRLALLPASVVVLHSQFSLIRQPGVFSGPPIALDRGCSFRDSQLQLLQRPASWDGGRFARTVSFFKGSPWKLLLPPFLQSRDATVSPSTPPASLAAGEVVLIDWGLSDGLPLSQAWGPLDDVVMGGVSSSAISASGGSQEKRRLTFTGRTSRENNGGFCSFRSRLFAPPLNLKAYDGLIFTARCLDGLRYKLQLRDNDGWDSVGWAVPFDTGSGGEEVTVKIPFESLVANFRSSIRSEGPPMKKESIFSLQFVLSAFEFDKRMNPRFKEGDFQLVLGPIRAYRDSRDAV